MNLKSSYKEKGNTHFLVELEISANELDSQFHNLIKKYSININFPGFRKGKVPTSIIEKKFSEEISKSVLEEIIPKAIEEVIKTHSLETIGPAELDKDHPVLKYEKGKPIFMKLIFNRKPSCTINSYEGLLITENKYTVEKEDINQNKKKILDSLGKNAEVEGEAQIGDMVYLNLSFKNEGLKEFNLQNHIAIFEEGGENAYPQYLNSLFKIIKKIKKGDTQEINFTFPQEINEEKLKGRNESVTLTINRINRFQPAELNQETFDRLQVKDEEELINKIKKDMEDHAQDQTKKHSFDEAIKALKKNTDFIIPEIAVDYYLQSSWNQLAEELRVRGQKNISESPPKTWLEENRSHAREGIETDLLITKVRKDKEIEIGEEELESKIKELAERSKVNLKDYRRDLIKSGGFTQLKRQMAHQKTLNWLLSQCKIIEEKEYPFSKLNELQKQYNY